MTLCPSCRRWIRGARPVTGECSCRSAISSDRRIGRTIGVGHAIVIVEPDGLADIVRGCLSPAASAERYQLLRYAMKELGGLPHTRVYLWMPASSRTTPGQQLVEAQIEASGQGGEALGLPVSDRASARPTTRS